MFLCALGPREDLMGVGLGIVPSALQGGLFLQDQTSSCGSERRFSKYDLKIWRRVRAKKERDEEEHIVPAVPHVFISVRFPLLRLPTA